MISAGPAPCRGIASASESHRVAGPAAPSVALLVCGVTVAARPHRTSYARPTAIPARTAREDSTSDAKVGVASVENLLCAALAVGLFVTSLRANAFGDSTTYRNYGLAIAGCLSGAAIVVGFAGLKGGQSRAARKSDALVVLGALYFGWAGIQNYFVQSDMLGAVTSLIAFLLVVATLAADPQRLNVALRRWLLLIVLASLLPALLGQGFEPNKRVWLSFLPGRYFAFSNPNALAFLAGLAVLLAVPVLRKTGGRVLVALAGVLVVLTAGITTAIGLGLALLAYIALGRARNTGLLRAGVAALAGVTPAVLIWLPSDSALRGLTALQEALDLSGRSFLWVNLVRLTRDLDTFWFGMGDRRVAFYTAGIQDVASAHSTILQIFLSEGFVTAVLFVLVAALATTRLLASGQTKDARISFAVVVYWFVTSLSSAQSGTALAFSVIVVLAIAHSRAARQPVPTTATRGRPLPAAYSRAGRTY